MCFVVVRWLLIKRHWWALEKVLSHVLSEFYVQLLNSFFRASFKIKTLSHKQKINHSNLNSDNAVLNIWHIHSRETENLFWSMNAFVIFMLVSQMQAEMSSVVCSRVIEREPLG